MSLFNYFSICETYCTLSEILFAIDHFNQIVRHELLRMISWKVGIETGFKLSVGKNYKFIERYISEDLGNPENFV